MKYCDTCHNTYPTDFATCPKDQTPLRAITDLVSGMVLRGKYRIEEKVGEGGMAAVYRASHLHFNEELAIKVVSNALSGNQDFLDRFKREAVITRKLRHPNAVRLDDFDITEDGRPFIAMEYVRGKSLRAVLQDEGNLPIPRAFNIARQVALALGAAHQLGIVHRDIKPDNVLLVPQSGGTDLVKVLDFGIAKVTGEPLQSGPGYKPTSTGMVLGTPHYLSPEQARGKKSEQIDGRSDLYSLGVMLYEMVSGELPFKSDTAIEMLLHHIQTQPVPTHVLKPEMQIPETVSALIMKALEKDPARRFPTGEQMAQALSEYSATAGPGPLEGPERTPAGGTISAFNTAAMAGASGSQPAVATATPPATVRATVPIPVSRDAETRVLGSFTVPMPAAIPTQDQQRTDPAAKVPVTSSGRKKSRRWLIWSAAGAAVLVILIWGAWELGSRSSAAQQTNDQPAADSSEPASTAPDAKASRRSHSGHKSEAQSNTGTSSRASNDANQKALAQQLVSQGNRQLAQRDFSGAQSSFQRALALDPENSAAQSGLKAAQAGALAQGIGSIFRH
jgi:serine/threonine-protein kinase